MQVKKEEVRQRILDQAEKEFLLKGFNGASLRKIVKSSGTTIGNFYNYFESKEVLFEELVSEEYSSFLNFIKNHKHNERPDRLSEITEVEQWRMILSAIVEGVVPVFSDRFLLLIEGSEGTRFESTKEILLQLLKEHFVEHLKEVHSQATNIELAEIIAEQFLSGILLILKRHREEGLRKNLIVEHVLFYIIGTMGLLGNKNSFL